MLVFDVVINLFKIDRSFLSRYLLCSVRKEEEACIYELLIKPFFFLLVHRFIAVTTLARIMPAQFSFFVAF